LPDPETVPFEQWRSVLLESNKTLAGRALLSFWAGSSIGRQQSDFSGSCVSRVVPIHNRPSPKLPEWDNNSHEADDRRETNFEKVPKFSPAPEDSVAIGYDTRVRK
jgi:hypothetical protein